MDYNDLKNKILSKPAFKDSLKADLEFEISQMIIDARVMRGLTQKQLADLVGTKQPSIARIESGSLLPTLTFLEKIAKALETTLIPPKFELTENLKVNIASLTEQASQFFPVPNQISNLLLVMREVQEVEQVRRSVVF
jgi:transcriptional regulator with XRE-family HTH domain